MNINIQFRFAVLVITWMLSSYQIADVITCFPPHQQHGGNKTYDSVGLYHWCSVNSMAKI